MGDCGMVMPFALLDVWAHDHLLWIFNVSGNHWRTTHSQWLLIVGVIASLLLPVLMAV